MREISKEIVVVSIVKERWCSSAICNISFCNDDRGGARNLQIREGGRGGACSARYPGLLNDSPPGKPTRIFYIVAA